MEEKGKRHLPANPFCKYLERMSCVEITEVKVYPVRKKGSEGGKIQAVASVTFDDRFVVHDFKIVHGSRGLFVSMPSRKRQNGEYVDIAHPISPEMREVLQMAILTAYRTHEEGARSSSVG